MGAWSAAGVSVAWGWLGNVEQFSILVLETPEAKPSGLWPVIGTAGP